MKKIITKLFGQIDEPKPAVEPTTHPTPEQTPYQLLGGEIRVRAIANRFYDIMASDPVAAPLYAIHPLPLDSIRERFFEFLSGWFGGPSLFEQKYGHPRLRMRHMPFTIDAQMYQQWMYCMNKTLDIEVDNPLLREALKRQFDALAQHMINQ